MKNILLSLIVLSLIGTLVLWFRHGGGAPYPNLSTTPLLTSSALEEVLAYDDPVGNVAINPGGRLFFTVHPEGRPTGNKLLEYVRGAAVPFPSGIDLAGNVYITDVEHRSIFVAGHGRELRTLITSEELRWPDALSFGPGGYLYIADSALPELILQSRVHIEASGPYRIFRFRAGFDGVPGQ